MPLRRVSLPPVGKPVRQAGPCAADDLAMPRRRRRVRPAAEGPLPSAEQLDTPDGMPNPASDYDVGYGKPTKHSRFKPGRSGNPMRGSSVTAEPLSHCFGLRLRDLKALSVRTIDVPFDLIARIALGDKDSKVYDRRTR